MTTIPNPKTDPEGWSLYWKEQINLAQDLLTYTISGIEHSRVAFGHEESERYTGSAPCRDCGVAIGQLHVPSCCLERCPACDCQAISCQCDYEPNQAISDERACCGKKLQEALVMQKSMPIIPTPDNRWW